MNAEPTNKHSPQITYAEWQIPDPVKVTLHTDSDFLVVVDLQKEYCHPKGGSIWKARGKFYRVFSECSRPSGLMAAKWCSL